MSIKLLSFDLDDTLWPCMVTIKKAEEVVHQWFLDNHPQISEQYSIEQLWQQRNVLRDQNPHLAHDISAVRYLSLQVLAQELKLSTQQSQEFIKQAFDIYYQARNQVTLFDDIMPVLQPLSADYKMVGVSNGNSDINRTTTGLDKLFEFSWSAAQAGKEKPHPKIFNDIMEKTGTNPHNIMHIGDDPLSDIQGAHNAGLSSIWLNRDKKTWPKDIKPAKYEINNFYQLNNILKQRS
jgi:FMN hydrolase / 5-amino-6-(5-phospho-D-ribitylamino)uracil phosphatase